MSADSCPRCGWYERFNVVGQKSDLKARIRELEEQLKVAVSLLTEACNYPYVDLPDDWYMRAKQLGESP